jgi:hypothetical protein
VAPRSEKTKCDQQAHFVDRKCAITAVSSPFTEKSVYTLSKQDKWMKTTIQIFKHIVHDPASLRAAGPLLVLRSCIPNYSWYLILIVSIDLVYEALVQLCWLGLSTGLTDE